MTGDVVISLMQEEDLEVVYEIEQSIYPQPWSINVFRGELARSDKRVYLVARVGGEIVGYAGLMLVDGEGHITNLAVTGRCRRRGIGELLVLRLVEMAMLRRIHWLTLEVRESNRSAQSLYEKFGFKSIGVRKGYYSDGENALIMWTNDIAGDEYKQVLESIKRELE